MSSMAPIVVFAYNRPDHLQQTLEHLSLADGALDSELWIFCDGPKYGADAAQIDAARVVAESPVWRKHFAAVRVEISDVNKGLASSIIQGVSRVILSAGHVIVVEDDVLVSPDFLLFMNDCLAFYQSNQKVGSITGFSPLVQPPAGYMHDVMAVPRNCSQCWATWADRWNEVDWGAHNAALIWQNRALRRRFNIAGNDRAYRLQRQLAGQIDSWSVRFGLWQTLGARHTIYPVHNRVRNIGYDGSGAHTLQHENVNVRALTDARPYRLEHISEDVRILRLFARIYGGRWHRRVLREIKARFQVRLAR